MCGIFSVVSNKSGSFQIAAATDTLIHRGPDDAGYYIDDFAGMGHRRLSIIDLEGGHQPVFNEDGNKCIVFNGEIYNFQELRETLIACGHIMKTKSDTETILHAYEEWGEKCVERLRGMFAFAIWDKIAKRLFVARDRLGIKPLFYAEHKGKLYVASEMKAILADPGFPRDIDETALASFFTLSYIPAPFTIYSKIRKLLPGHTLTWDNGNIRIKKYWDLIFAPDRGQDEKYFINGFMDLLHESVKIHLISDVPLGAFLSGGVDSSTIVALMSGESTGRVNTFCIGFGGDAGGYLDERGYAKSVAERYITNHREFEVLPKPDDLIDKIVTAFDEPFADDSTIPSYFVCKIARENVKVALSGLGGDEVFAGYERYLGFRMRSLYNRVPSFVRNKVLLKLAESLPERADGHYTVNHIKRFLRSSSLSSDRCYLGFISKIKPDIRRSFFSDQERFERHSHACDDLIMNYFNSPNVHGNEDSLDRALYCDIKTYLPEDILAATDRMSMLHSLEVRVPFLDHKFMEFCATIPPEMKIKWFQKKYLLKKAVKGFLPEDVITHRKQGFVGPMTRWLQNELKPYVLETLSEQNLKRHGYFNYNSVKSILDEHFSGKEIHDTLIWSMIMFQKWHERYFERNILDSDGVAKNIFLGKQ